MKNRSATSIAKIIAITIFFPILFYSCELFNFNKDKEKPSKNLIIGEEIEVASETVPASGATVIVDAPGSKIDGMEIMVPAGSYPSSRTFNITTAEISSHNLGEYFNPITPLIQIENGSGYSDSIMEITIPISIKEGEIPLGFYYDEITGKLEAIPVKSYTNNSVTLLTRHFMPASKLRVDNENLKGISIDATSNMIISSISESVLNKQNIISSGFKIGEDNWEFVNNGSYLAPGGHCAGQNLGAAWYYFEKKLKGEPNLNGRFSTIPGKDFDNAIGYRFCSVLQEDYANEVGFIRSFSWKYIDKEQNLDKMKWYTIAGAMLTTGEPQLVAIYRTIDDNNDGVPDTYPDGEIKYGGHSIICYEISVNDGKLYICDPNYPQTGQVVEYDNNTNLFKPYNGKANGRASSYSYKYITWNAKTALVDWPQMGKRYKELSDSTIGNIAPNTFPEYIIRATGKSDKLLTNNFTTENDTLTIAIEDLATGHSYNIDGKWYFTFDAYDEDGKKIDIDKNNLQDKIKLNPGLNKIGIYIHVKYPDAYGYVDFKWFNVYYSKLTIDPNPIVGEPDEKIDITALSQGTAPANVKYIWNFGDKTKEVTVKNDSTVTHTFDKEGDYTVTVDMYDNSNGKLVGHAEAEANIADGILKRLQKFKYISVDFNADFVSNNDIISFSSLSVDNSPPWGSKQSCPLVWSGTSFSATFDYSYELFSGEKVHSTGTISGNMSANGRIIKSFTAHEISQYPELGDVFKYDVSARDVPYQPDYEYDEYNPRFSVEGPTVSQYINSYSQSWDFTDSDGKPQSLYSTSINYNDPEDVPYLHITFSGSN